MGGTEHAEDYTFLYGTGNENQQVRAEYFVHQRLVSEVKTAEFVSDRCHIHCSEIASLILFWMLMHQLRIKVVTQTTVSMRN